MVKNIIEVENISYTYNPHDEEARNAIDGLSMNVKEGEFLAVLGHNGSGKSTLSKMFNGLLIPSQGSVRVNDLLTSDYDNILEIREKVGMVFQNPDNQIVATIVEEDVAFGPENLGIPSEEIRRRVDQALELVGMSEYTLHAPHLLSGGQKQRVAIAGILAMMPDCIVFDEPTSMLDPNGRIEVMDTINKLNKEENKTIVLITHYMDEAIQADRIIVMENGKIALEGSPREVFNEVDTIKNLGLDVPQVVELAHELKKEGIDINTNILSIEELLNEL